MCSRVHTAPRVQILRCGVCVCVCVCACVCVACAAAPPHRRYRQSVIEVDAGFGVYNGCNPYANGTVECHPYVRGPVCWYNSTCGGRQPDGSYVGAIGPFCLNSTAADRAAEAKFQKSFRPLCSRSRCSCEDELTRAVGKWPCVFCRRDDGPPHKQTPLWKQINKFAQTLNGNWFSTRRGGECAEGERPGTGKCFWREVKLLKNANATCVRRNFLAAVAKRNAGCYAGCAQPRNTSTPCYVECMLGTITGMGPQAAGSQVCLSGRPSHAVAPPLCVPPSVHLLPAQPRPRAWVVRVATRRSRAGPQRCACARFSQAMSRQELLAPFERAFASSDESKGGCPDVPVGADELLGQA